MYMSGDFFEKHTTHKLWLLGCVLERAINEYTNTETLKTAVDLKKFKQKCRKKKGATSCSFLLVCIKPVDVTMLLSQFHMEM